MNERPLVLPAWALRDPRIKPGATREVLLRHEDEHGVASPTIADLASELGYSDTAVRGAIRALERAGVIEVERRQAAGLASVYRVCGTTQGRAADSTRTTRTPGFATVVRIVRKEPS